MSNKKQRMKNRDTAAKLKLSLAPKIKCHECGELTHHGHFAPPSFGQDGFWTCDKFYDNSGRRIT